MWFIGKDPHLFPEGWFMRVTVASARHGFAMSQRTCLNCKASWPCMQTYAELAMSASLYAMQVIDPTGAASYDQSPSTAPDHSHLTQNYREQPSQDWAGLCDDDPDDQISDPDLDQKGEGDEDEDDDPNMWLADPPKGEIYIWNHFAFWKLSSASTAHGMSGLQTISTALDIGACKHIVQVVGSVRSRFTPEEAVWTAAQVVSQPTAYFSFVGADFRTEMSPFGAIYTLLDSWPTESTRAYLLSKDGADRQLRQSQILGTSQEMLKTMSRILARVVPFIVREMQVHIPRSTVEKHMFEMLASMHFTTPIPAIKVISLCMQYAVLRSIHAV